MSPIAIGILAIGMSADSLIASIGLGASAHRPNLPLALRAGVTFGMIEAITPLIGWSLGVVASQYVRTFDHWIAFTLLAGIGARMVFSVLRRGRDDPVAIRSNAFLPLVMTAVGTSIDAMVVGVSLAFLNVNIIAVALCIGLTTMVMSTTGVLAGRFLGARFGHVAELIGGLALIGLGSFILFDHLTA